MYADLPPSPWVVRFAGLVSTGGPVLDLAAGAGRHTRFFRGRGHPVTAIDRDAASLRRIEDQIEVIEADLEDGSSWPVGERRFAGIVVTNYLHRLLFPSILAALAPGGALLYETFALGNERFGKPSNPDFLLRPGELLEVVRGRLRVVAYEDVELAEPKPALVQRIVAVSPAA